MILIKKKKTYKGYKKTKNKKKREIKLQIIDYFCKKIIFSYYTSPFNLYIRGLLIFWRRVLL